jgi:hypothetical protein
MMYTTNYYDPDQADENNHGGFLHKYSLRSKLLVVLDFF